MRKEITVFIADEPEEVADVFTKVLRGLGLRVTKEMADNATEWKYTIASGERLNLTAQYRIADEANVQAMAAPPSTPQDNAQK